MTITQSEWDAKIKGEQAEAIDNLIQQNAVLCRQVERLFSQVSSLEGKLGWRTGKLEAAERQVAELRQALVLVRILSEPALLMEEEWEKVDRLLGPQYDDRAILNAIHKQARAALAREEVTE